MACLEGAGSFVAREDLEDARPLPSDLRLTRHGERTPCVCVCVCVFCVFCVCGCVCVFRAQGFRVQGSRFRVQGSGFRAQGAGFRVQGSGFKAQGAGYWGWRRVGVEGACPTLARAPHSP